MSGRCVTCASGARCSFQHPNLYHYRLCTLLPAKESCCHSIRHMKNVLCSPAKHCTPWLEVNELNFLDVSYQTTIFLGGVLGQLCHPFLESG
jgi:hypothetical protein